MFVSHKILSYTRKQAAKRHTQRSYGLDRYVIPVGKFKAALVRSHAAASFSSKLMKFALFTSHKDILVVIMFDQVFSHGIIQSCLHAPFSTKFDDAPTDVVNLLLCDNDLE